MNPYRKDYVDLLRSTWRERLWLGSHRYAFAFTMVCLMPAFCFAISESLVALDRNELRHQLDAANETIRRQSELVKSLSLKDHPTLNEPVAITLLHDANAGEVLCPCEATTNTYCFVSPTDAGDCP